jgi:hypothetical protein
MKFLLYIVVLSFACLSSQAAVLTLEGPDDFSTPILRENFTFAFTAGGYGIFIGDPCCGGSIVENGTTRLVAAGDRDLSNAVLVLSPTGGGLFSLTSLDAATAFERFSGSIEITGNLAGGGTISQTISVTDTFTNFVLNPGFTNLVSVQFRDPISGDFLTTPGFSLDNLVVDVTAVPEPGTLVLVGGAFVAIGMRRRLR